MCDQMVLQAMIKENSKIGDLNEEFDHYCSENLKPITEEDDLDTTIAKAEYNVTVAAELARQLIRAKFDQEIERRRKC